MQCISCEEKMLRLISALGTNNIWYEVWNCFEPCPGSSYLMMVHRIKLPVEDEATTLGLLCCVYYSDLSYQFIIYGSILKLPYWIGGWDLSHSFLRLMQTKILLTWQVEFPFLCITQRQKSILQTIEYQIDNGVQQQIWCKRLCNRAIQFNSMSEAFDKKANMEAKQFSPQKDLQDFVSQFNVFTFWYLLAVAF